MSLDPKIIARVKSAQETIFEQCGRVRKDLAYRTSLHQNTVDKHATGDSVMSIAALHEYAKHIDTELLSMLLPDGLQIVRVPESVDHDELAAAMHDYLSAKTKAHCPSSPAGRELSECEQAALNGKAASLKAVAS